MKRLVQALENENVNIELYLNQINSLSDKEIENLFDNKNISEEMKDNILVFARERINRLSTKSFIKVSSWASSVEEYKKNYFSKIEEMAYEDFIDLIYNGIYEPSILLEIVKTDTYKKYLQQEKVKQKKDDLQCLDIQRRLDSSNSIIKDLNEICKEIMGLEMWNILQNNSKKTKNLEYVEDNYLNSVIENINDIDLESKSIKVCFYMMNSQMQYHQMLTNKMIEFYLYYRIKELNLRSVCENVIITLGESDCFGYYTTKDDILSGGTLKIFSDYLPRNLRKYNPEIGSEAINVNTNLKSLRLLSHELAHILIRKDYFALTENQTYLDWFQSCYTNKRNNYLHRGSQLHSVIGEKGYNKNHDIFIEEVWADMFSFFDSNKQLLTNFKNCYPETAIENNISDYANRIVEYYTNEDGTMLSPMEKFDAFYLENIGDEQEPIVQDEIPDIMSSLMMGDKIPLDVFQFLQKIANGEIKTIDLYQTLTTYLQNRTELSSNSLEKEVEEQNPSL